MKKCKIFISPSIREGFGFSVLEASYAGARVIISGHSDNLTNRSLKDASNITIVDQDTSEAYAEAIKLHLSRENVEALRKNLSSIPSHANTYRAHWDLMNELGAS
jgi:glycosyltransferase involved in cell wall biosynthesis